MHAVYSESHSTQETEKLFSKNAPAGGDVQLMEAGLIASSLLWSRLTYAVLVVRTTPYAPHAV